MTQPWDKELGFSQIGGRTCPAEDPMLPCWTDSSGSSVVPKATMTGWLRCAEQLQIPTRPLAHHGGGVQLQYRVRSPLLIWVTFWLPAVPSPGRLPEWHWSVEAKVTVKGTWQ